MTDKVYTRKGDDGTTQLLFAGKDRVLKASARVAAYGDGDEAVSALGIARAEALEGGLDEIAGIVLGLQRELFVVNAELATPPEHAHRLTDEVSRVTQAMVDALEHRIDELTASFEQPRDFIVPGNTKLGAALDHAGRVIRRAERSAVTLSGTEAVRAELLRYLNRLADLAWVLARFAEAREQQPRSR